VPELNQIVTGVSSPKYTLNLREVHEQYVFWSDTGTVLFSRIFWGFPCQLFLHQCSLFILPLSGRQKIVPPNAVFPNTRSPATTRINKCKRWLHDIATGYGWTKRKAFNDVLIKSSGFPTTDDSAVRWLGVGLTILLPHIVKSNLLINTASSLELVHVLWVGLIAGIFLKR
jgi:hypothetical protein